MSKNTTQSGHRSRLRERFMKSDIRSLADYEILEMLLFNVFRQKDTKTLSQNLIQNSGSLLQVIQNHGKVKGAGDKVSNYFRLLNLVYQYIITQEHNTEEYVFSSWLSVVN